MTYENPWTYNGNIVDSEVLNDYLGFIYKITNLTTQRMYIGKKLLKRTKTRVLKGKKKRSLVESDWKEYYGSSEDLKKQIEVHGKNNFRREILSLHLTKGDVNYAEVREQFMRDVLEKDGYINDNINGKWFRKPQHIKAARRLSAASSWRAYEPDSHGS